RISNQQFEIIDTPGLHCLYIHSEDELQVRDAIFQEKPDIILQCIDANRLKQSLSLTADLLTLSIPIIISLNSIDETTRRGMWIDSDGLSRLIGVPVIESMAVYGQGTDEIKKAILNTRQIKKKIQYSDIIEHSITNIESLLLPETPYKRTLAILSMMNDHFIFKQIEKTNGEKISAQIRKEVEQIKQKLKWNIIWNINKSINAWIDNIVEKVLKKQKLTPKQFSQKIAKFSRHPIYGVPILFLVIYIMFFFVVNVANTISEWLNSSIWQPIESLLKTVITNPFLHDFLIGPYGVLSTGLANALLTVLPILSVFFLMFNILEDIGYIPNLSVLTHRLFSKIGLTGSAIMPIVLGFGCKTMATLTTKSLSTQKERYIAIFLIAFAVPCAVQFGINLSILGRLGFSAFIITFFVLFLVEAAAGIILNKILKDYEEKRDFIQELPDIRLPVISSVIKKTYYRLFWFLKESLLVFIYAALLLFVFDKTGILTVIEKICAPIIEGFLGLPSSMVDIIILCLARRETAAALIINLLKRGELNYVQSIVAVVVTTMLMPCFANIMAMVKEIGIRKTIFMVISINLAAFLIGGMLSKILIIIFPLL
ncbi:MAG: ferrous iron transporter B, partial [Desulfobacterales bacterium]|nr:ferrous iron transporter B [Desulfobacterales bacterium]